MVSMLHVVVSALLIAGPAGDGCAAAAADQPGSRPQRQNEIRDDAPASHVSRRSAPSAAPQRGPYPSVQVNVDAQGQNILGDAANEPTIAVDPTNPDVIVIGWRQFDSITSNFREAGHAYSHDGGRTWTFPGALDDGVFRSDPVLATNANGVFYYYSLLSTDPYTCDMFISSDGGVTWSAPIAAFGGDKPWTAVDHTRGIGHGNIYAAWDYAGCCGEDWFTRSTDGGWTYWDPVYIADQPYWGTIAIGPQGEVYVAGCTDNRSIFALAVSSNSADPLTEPVFERSTLFNLGGELQFYLGTGPNPGGLLSQVWVVCDHSGGPRHGYLYVLASVNPPGNDPQDVMFCYSADGGLTFSDPRRVNSDPPGVDAWQWFGTMSIAPNGRLDVVWNDTRRTGQDNLSQVFYTYSTDGGTTWAHNTPVTPVFDSYVGWPQQNKLGDYYHMVSDEAGVNLAYAATFNGEQDVYFVRLGDCNGNGVHDALDLANQTSSDINGNDVPDECEPDCNGNGVPDDWDIATGAADDCNTNGVPDECDIAEGIAADVNHDGVPDDCAVCLGAETAKLVAADGAADDQFGFALAADGAGGSRAIVGANMADGPATDAGAAYVLRGTDSGWVQETRLLAVDADEQDYFGCAVSLWGDVAVVGASGDDGGGTDHGAAYVFRYVGESWVQEAKLLADDGTTGAKFGFALAVAGDVVAVGAYGDDERGADAGAVYVYRWDGSAWQPEEKLLLADGATGDYFGCAVAAATDVLVVGASGDDDDGTVAGAAYVYRASGGTWLPAERLRPDDLTANDRFGTSVAVAGGPPARAIVGASRYDGGGSATGAAYVFVADGETWLTEARLLPVEIENGAWLGQAVAITAGPPWRAVVGAYGDSTVAALAGSAHLFWNAGDGWFDAGRLQAIDPGMFDTLGYAVAVTGDTVLAGAYGRDDAAVNSGAVYAFGGAGDCDANDVADLCDLAGGAADANGNGLLDVCELLPGDLNCDGLVNNLDIRPFVQALTDAAGYTAAHPDCLLLNADTNGDGTVSNFDIRPFVELLTGP